MAHFTSTLLAVLLTALFGKAYPTYNDPATPAAPTPVNDTSPILRNVIIVKMGVAAGMFILVLLASGMPTVVYICLQKRRFPENEVSRHQPSTLAFPPSSSSSPAHLTPASIGIQEKPTLYESESFLIQRNLPDAYIRSTTNEDYVDTYSSEGNNLNANKAALLNNQPSFENNHLLTLWISRITCFAAGVFLCTALMDLYPEVEEAVTVALSKLEMHLEYPFAALFTLFGFFLVLMIEQVTITLHSPHQHRLYSPSDTNSSLLANRQECNGSSQAGHAIVSPCQQDIPAVEVRSPSKPHCTTPHQMAPSHNFMRSTLLVMALSVHSVFEGLAVGLQKSVHQVLALFTALLLHKLIMTLGIGLNMVSMLTGARTFGDLLRQAPFRAQFLAILVFAFSSPLGLLFGSFLLTDNPSGSLLMTIAVLQGVACGTFFFVVFCEILPEELNEGSQDRLGKSIFITLGACLVSIYIYFQQH